MREKTPSFPRISDEFVPWYTQNNNDTQPVNVCSNIDCNSQVGERMEIKQMNGDEVPQGIKIFEIKDGAAKHD